MPGVSWHRKQNNTRGVDNIGKVWLPFSVATSRPLRVYCFGRKLSQGWVDSLKVHESWIFGNCVLEYIILNAVANNPFEAPLPENADSLFTLRLPAQPQLVRSIAVHAFLGFPLEVRRGPWPPFRPSPHVSKASMWCGFGFGFWGPL